MSPPSLHASAMFVDETGIVRRHIENTLVFFHGLAPFALFAQDDAQSVDRGDVLGRKHSPPEGQGFSGVADSHVGVGIRADIRNFSGQGGLVIRRFPPGQIKGVFEHRAGCGAAAPLDLQFADAQHAFGIERTDGVQAAQILQLLVRPSRLFVQLGQALKRGQIQFFAFRRPQET